MPNDDQLKEIVYIPLTLIDSPTVDVRYYRSQSFISRLAEDIELESFPTPIDVVQKGDRYDVIDGYTRVLAYRKLNRLKIPAIIRSLPDEKEAVWKRLKIGVNHRDIDPMGVANALLWLRNNGFRQKDIAERMKWSKGYVSKLVKIARHLKEEDKLRLAKGEITTDIAYSLVSGEPYSPAFDEEISRKKLYRCDICYNYDEEESVFKLRVCRKCQNLLRSARKRRAKQRRLDEKQKELP